MRGIIKMHKPLYLVIVSLFFNCNAVHADVYKCKSSSGKIIYSESPCEGMPVEKMEILDNSIDSSRLRREANSFRANGSIVSESAKPVSTTELMSDFDRKKRIEENIVTSKSVSAFSERKNDALYENGRLSRARVKALSYEDSKKRANLKVDLGSLDYRKRQEAAAKLITLYQNY